MFKLIAIDLDGTLLDNDKKITSENIETINTIIDKGYKVVIATGRNYYSAKELTKDLIKDIIILANNGNIIRNTSDDKVIYSRFLDMKDIGDILTMGKSINLHPIIHVDYYDHGYDMIIESDIAEMIFSSYLKGEKRYKKKSIKEISDIDRVLAIVYPGEKDTLVSLAKKINDNFPNCYSSHVLENINIAEAMLEIMTPLGNKWNNLLNYCSLININPDEIIAIGDDNNDIEMIMKSGLGIAMKNACKSVKEAAEVVSERDNNDSGVAYELKKALDI